MIRIKNKSIKVISVIILACIGLTACSNESSKKEPTIYVSMAMGKEMPKEFERYEDVHKTGIHTKTEKIELRDAKKTRPSFFDKNVEYDYFESICEYEYKDSENLGKFYSVFDRYCDESEKYFVSYIRGTDYICQYLDKTESVDEVSKNYISLEQGKDIAEKFIKDNIDRYKEYTYEEAYLLMGTHYYSYVRFINGYKTDDMIEVGVKENGKVRMYTAFDYAKYDTLMDVVTKENLEEAKKILLEQVDFLENVDKGTEKFKIYTNEKGEVFLQMTVEPAGIGFLAALYVKVE